jgi:EAL domain-containing protein (putative c-di-GMP-specific phosphodiesterase class I)
LLFAAAERLRANIRSIDALARSAGDEFIILLDCIIDEQQIDRITTKLISEFRKPFQIQGVDIFTTISIGVVSADRAKHDTPVDCLRDADAALYEAKKMGRDRHEFFSPRLYEQAVRHLELGSELRVAIEKNQLCLYYMPIYSLTQNRISGLEALIRWKHPERGLIEPLHFIEFAEETGLILEIGNIALEAACRQAVQWRSGGHDIFMAVNISARQFRQDGFAKIILETVAASGLEASALELEITESSMMENPERSGAVLAELRNSSVKLSIDDFGTGYSSLNYLQHYPFHTLKIDRSFLRNTEEAQNSEIIRSIVLLAHSLSLKVIAEGIETNSQLELVRSFGCDEVQGFLIGKPMPAEQMEDFLKTFSARFSG